MGEKEGQRSRPRAEVVSNQQYLGISWEPVRNPDSQAHRRGTRSGLGSEAQLSVVTTSLGDSDVCSTLKTAGLEEITFKLSSKAVPVNMVAIGHMSF